MARPAVLLWHVAALGTAAAFVLPLVWVLAASLRQPGLPPPRTIEWLPSPVSWGNYPALFEMLPFGRYVLNSTFVVALAVPLTVLTASWAGFAMAQLRPAAQRRLVVLSLLLLMVPITALWLVRFLLFKYAGLLDTLWSLIIPSVAGSSPFFVLLFYWSFKRIPRELYELARLEGAGALSIWGRVAMPLAGSTILAVVVLSFLLYWSDFINPLLYLKREALYTLPVGLQQLQQLDRTNWPLLMAGSVVMAAPVVLTFLLSQHYILQTDPRSRVQGG